MRRPLRRLGFRFTTGQLWWAAVLIPLVVVWLYDTRYARWGFGVLAAVVLLAVIVVGGRRLHGWVGVLFGWLLRRRKPLNLASEPVVGATVMPADHVAVRWQDGSLVALIELLPRPFTPTVIVERRARTDDVVDTRLVEHLLSVYAPDLEADVVSAGYRIGKTAATGVLDLYEEAVGSDPAPAHRRTWITLLAEPVRTRDSAERRDDGIAGLAGYLITSTTRLADALARNGVDAKCERSFDDFDDATGVGFERERWSGISGPDNVFTAAYAATGGPDAWWSAHADHTITRFRIAVDAPPRSTVLLTTAAKSKTPKGFSRMSGAQRGALKGQTLVADRHWRMPIGSAGVLIGETVSKCPVYMPFDDVDSAITLADARTFAQFAVRAAAAGGMVTVAPQFRTFADLIGARVGPDAGVVWPNATTHLGQYPDVDRVSLRHNAISTPRHRQLPIRLLSPPEESRYEKALPR